MSVLLTAWNSGLMLGPAIGGRIRGAAWILAMTKFFIFWLLIISGPLNKSLGIS